MGEAYFRGENARLKSQLVQQGDEVDRLYDRLQEAHEERDAALDALHALAEYMDENAPRMPNDFAGWKDCIYPGKTAWDRVMKETFADPSRDSVEDVVELLYGHWRSTDDVEGGWDAEGGE